jgi:hypothetical protein
LLTQNSVSCTDVVLEKSEGEEGEMGACSTNGEKRNAHRFFMGKPVGRRKTKM